MSVMCLMECDHESLIMRRPWPTRAVVLWYIKKKNKKTRVLFYFIDVISLYSTVLMFDIFTLICHLQITIL